MRLTRGRLTRGRLTTAITAALLLAGCHAPAADDGEAGQEPSNFTPPAIGTVPATPVRLVDDVLIHDLAAGKTEGLYLLDLRRVPAAIRREIAAERTEDAACRAPGGDPDAPAACARRDVLAAALRRRHWCWGPDAEVEADRRWMREGAGCRGSAGGRR